jgi:hypothetical protein
MLFVSLIAALTVAGAATADPPTIATLSGFCDNKVSRSGDYQFPTLGQSFANSMIRVSGTSARVVGEFPGVGIGFFDAGVVEWQEAGPLATAKPYNGTIDCSAAATAYRLDLVAVPSTPASYSGLSSPHDDASTLLFNAPADADYVATLTLTQGSVTLDGHAAASSGQLDLGVLPAGEHSIELQAKDGPYAAWTASIAASPVLIADTSFASTLSRPGVVVEAHYSTTGAGTVHAVILDANDQVVRVLAETLNVGRGLHGLSWDGLRGNGVAVPDGAYRLHLDLTDATGAATTSEAEIMIDGNPPTVVTSKFLTPRRGLVVVARDAMSGVRSTTVRAGGKTVRGTTGIVILPRNGWKRGFTYRVQIVSIDKAGNRATVAKMLRVR